MTISLKALLPPLMAVLLAGCSFHECAGGEFDPFGTNDPACDVCNDTACTTTVPARGPGAVATGIIGGKTGKAARG